MPAFTKIPAWLQVYNKYICWNISDADKTLYLTFDDGPHPLATPQVLDILSPYDVKATFFCIGKHVEQYPYLYQRIREEGHSVGNHTYSHFNGWKTSSRDYLKDTVKAGRLIQSKLFRPPYGRMTPAQFRALKKKYKIVMWDVLSKDYQKDVSDDEVINNVTENISPGSIVVMHDNQKTSTRINKVLPSILIDLLSNGWNFKTLEFLQ